MDKSILISTAIPNQENADASKAYSTSAAELIKKAGGVILGRHPVTKTIVGKSFSGVILLAEFPNEKSIVDLFESAEYKALIPLRDKGFKEINLYIGK